VATAKVLLRREQQIDHQLDNLARCKVLPRLLVRLFGADPNQLFEDVTHLNVIHALRGKIDFRESLDDFIEQIFLRHPSDLLVEREPIHNVAHVLGEPADVAVEIERELVWIVEKLGEIELGEVIKRPARGLLKQASNDVLRLTLDLSMFRENLCLCGRQQTIESSQDR
jgi:hypothetical protein